MLTLSSSTWPPHYMWTSRYSVTVLIRPIAHQWNVTINNCYTDTDWLKQLVQQNKDNFTEDYIISIAVGAAKAGRITLCCDALMKWPHSTSTPKHRFAQELAASAAKCTDTAVLDRVLRMCILVSNGDVAHMVPSCVHDRTCMLNCCGALKRWHQVAECSDKCTARLPLDQFAALCDLRIDGNNRYDVSRQLIWALVRSGQPMLHAHFMQHYRPDWAEDLVNTVSQKGRTDVLDYLYDLQLLMRIDILRAVHTGAVEGDRVVTVKWLHAHELLQADTRQKLTICNKKLKAFFTEFDQTTSVQQH
eukprot:7643-Heterococcus_DN1.PRE.7